MTAAVITYCGHIYHGSCLRKWLYVQETCPMCHASIKPSSADQMAGAGDAQPQQAQQPTEQQPHPEHSQQEEQGAHGDAPHSTQCKTTFSNSNCSKVSAQNLLCGANGDSQVLEDPSCSTEQNPSQEKCKNATDETQKLREAD